MPGGHQDRRAMLVDAFLEFRKGRDTAAAGLADPFAEGFVDVVKKQFRDDPAVFRRVVRCGCGGP